MLREGKSWADIKAAIETWENGTRPCPLTFDPRERGGETKREGGLRRRLDGLPRPAIAGARGTPAGDEIA